MSETRVKQHPTLGILVCTDGHVYIPYNYRNKAHWTLGSKTKMGYLLVGINNQRLYVHRLVAETFIPNPKNNPEVDHIDRNPANNKVSNLRWVTSKDNMRNTIQNDRCFEKYGVHQYTDMNAYKRKFIDINYKKTHKQIIFSDKSKHWVTLKDAQRLLAIHWTLRIWEKEKTRINSLHEQTN